MANTAKQTDDALVSPPGPRRLLAPRLAGAALLAATAGIHLDLYATGYKLIPVIGWLFLLQVIGGFVLAAAVAVTRGGLGTLTAFLGAGYAASTLLGYLVSMWIGLFGFTETRTTAGLVAGVIEVAALAVLGYVTLHGLPQAGPLAPLHKVHASLPGGAAAVISAVSVVAVIVLGLSLATATAPSSGPSVTAAAGAASSGPVLKMTMKNFKFFPANPEVQPGERVEVTNFDAAPHSVSSGVPPKDSSLFDTGLLAQGKTGFFIAPKKAGRYPFFCLVHHFMVGMLIVK
ncbi:MAG TPA: cupredoxin domain-containing protein [Streptosporangiaceae bacterium]